MGKAEYFIAVCPGYGVGHYEFDIDYLFTENLIRRFQEGSPPGKVYSCGIVPEAVPHAVRLLKKRRSFYSMFNGKTKSFYLCFETWAGFQWPTDEVKKISVPEKVKARERELKQYSKASLKRLDEMYAALKKADEETLNSVALFRVAVCDTMGAKKPQKELYFTPGGIWFISADELRGYTIKDQQAFLAGLVDDPAKVVLDPLTEAVFSAVADAERPYLLFDDGGEDRTETAEGAAGGDIQEIKPTAEDEKKLKEMIDLLKGSKGKVDKAFFIKADTRKRSSKKRGYHRPVEIKTDEGVKVFQVGFTKRRVYFIQDYSSHYYDYHQ